MDISVRGAIGSGMISNVHKGIFIFIGASTTIYIQKSSLIAFCQKSLLSSRPCPPKAPSTKANFAEAFPSSNKVDSKVLNTLGGGQQKDTAFLPLPSTSHPWLELDNKVSMYI